MKFTVSLAALAFSLLVLTQSSVSSAQNLQGCMSRQAQVDVTADLLQRHDLYINRINRRIVRANELSARILKIILVWRNRLEAAQAVVSKELPSCQTENGSRSCRLAQQAQNTIKRINAGILWYEKRNISYLSYIATLSQTRIDAIAKRNQVEASLLAAKQLLETCLSPVSSSSSSVSSQGSIGLTFNFDDMVVGSKYPIWQGFSKQLSPGSSQLVEVVMSPFYYLHGGNSAAQSVGSFQFSAEIVRGNLSGVASNSVGLWPGNVNAGFKLPQGRCANVVEFQYYDGGGEVNLGVNGQLKLAQDFSELVGSSVAGATITGRTRSSDQVLDSGLIRVQAQNGTCINSVSIGGQELFLDYISFWQIR